MSIWPPVAGLIALALAFVLVPLWRTAARLPGSGTNRAGLSNGRVALGAALLLSGMTLGLYHHLGAPRILVEQALTEAQSRYDADGMVKALEDKLRSNPDDIEGWYALGRAYIAMERPAEAEQALARAFEKAPRDARILAQYAEAVALRTGSLQGRAHELVMQALEIDYEEDKALELAGLAAFQQQNWAESLHFWRRLLKKLPKGSELQESIAQAVAVAEQKSAEAAAQRPPTGNREM